MHSRQLHASQLILGNKANNVQIYKFSMALRFCFTIRAKLCTRDDKSLLVAILSLNQLLQVVFDCCRSREFLPPEDITLLQTGSKLVQKFSNSYLEKLSLLFNFIEININGRGILIETETKRTGKRGNSIQEIIRLRLIIFSHTIYT